MTTVKRSEEIIVCLIFIKNTPQIKPHKLDRILRFEDVARKTYQAINDNVMGCIDFPKMLFILQILTK